MVSMGSGMDMSSDGMFKGTNNHAAREYWYIVVAVVILLGLRRAFEDVRTRITNAVDQRTSHSVSSRP
jgi:hypothetical protein